MAFPSPRWTKRIALIHIRTIPSIVFYAPAVNEIVTTFFAATPQATLQQLTKAGITIPFAWATVTVDAEVAPAKEVVKYSVNTF